MDRIIFMNPEAAKILSSLVLKEPHELTQADIRFLHARWDYLTEEQQIRFASVRQDAPLPKGSGSKLGDYKYHELIRLAKELGIKAKIGMKREEIEKLITEDTSYFP